MRFTVPLRILVLFLILTTNTFSSAYIEIAGALARTDSVVETVAQKAGSISSLFATDKFFKKVVSTNNEFTYLMKVNSKGKIISKVSQSKVYPRNYRYVGKQKWFKAVSAAEKNYYTVVKTKSNHYLFWARPTSRKTRNGSVFSGAIIAKISLKKLIQNSCTDTPVKVTYGKKTIYSTAKENTGLSLNKMLIPGMGSICIMESPSKEHVIPISESKATKKEAETAGESVKQENRVASQSQKAIKKRKGEKTTKPVKHAKKKKSVKPKAIKEKSSGGIGGILLAILSLLAAGCGAFFIVIMVKKSSEKQRLLMEEIDKME